MTAPTPWDRLLDAAQAVIAEEGWSAATTRRVADRAGLAPGLVHYHAGTIDHLRREATLQALRRFFGQGMRLESLSRMELRPWLTQLLTSPPAGDQSEQDLRIVHESLSVALRDPHLRREIASLLGNYRATISRALTASGVGDTAAVAIAATVTAAVDGAVLQRMLDPNAEPAPIIDTLERLIVDHLPAPD